MQWRREGVAVYVPSEATVGTKKSYEVKKHLTLLHSMESCAEKAAYLHLDTILTTVKDENTDGNKGVNLVREILARLHTPELQKVAKELAEYPVSVQL